MDAQEIKDYRKILEKEFTEKDSEIETQLGYITIGALGFFITINEKFLKIQEAEYRQILLLSLLFLFLSLVLLIYRKSRTISDDLSMIRFVDAMNQDSPDDDQELSIIWKKSNK